MRRSRLIVSIGLFLSLTFVSGCGNPSSPAVQAITPNSQTVAGQTQTSSTPTSATSIAQVSPSSAAVTPSLRRYPQVILGKDDWLFYGDPINKLVRDGPLTDDQITQMVDELKAINDMLAAQGVHFLFVLVPDKQLVYPEYMADKYLDDGPLTAYQRMSQALTASGIDFIDSRAVLLEKKQEVNYRLYYMRDNRWNPLGNFIMTQEVSSHLAKAFSVPQYQLTGVDTSESRVVTGEFGNDLNDMLQSLNPLYEKGDPEPIYNVSTGNGTPSILWYGDCFSAPWTQFLQQSWPSDITYVSLWGQYGFPPSLQQDIKHRLDGQKVVVFQMDEHYRRDLKRSLTPESPRVDTSWSLTYDWTPDNFLTDWTPDDEYDTQTIDDKVNVTIDQQHVSLSYYVSNLAITPTKKHYLVIKFNAPVGDGVTVDFSRTSSGEYTLEGRQGQHTTKGDNTLIFDFPAPDVMSSIKSIRVFFGQTPGIYGISEISIYTAETAN